MAHDIIDERHSRPLACYNYELMINLLLSILVSWSWDPAALSNPSGADVEKTLTQTGGHTGSMANRRYLEVGAAKWVADYQESIPSTRRIIIN